MKMKMKIMPIVLSTGLIGIPAIVYLIYKYEKKKRMKFPTKRIPLKRIPLDQLPKLQNDLIIRAALNQPTERVPVWCMRQAGRHLPEFRSLRNAGYDFFTMCQVPELAAEVTLQPFRRYNLDAIIIFSDILVIPQAMGMKVTMVPGKGPVLSPALKTDKDILNLDLSPNVNKKLDYVMDAINLTRQLINGKVPLIGFCGSPLTILTYMVEGGASKTKSKIKSWLYNRPNQTHELLQSITNTCISFLIAQANAGAQVLQVFETVCAEAVTQEHFYEFGFTYLAQIASKVKEALPNIPLIGFSKGTPYAYKNLANTRFDCLGLDWQSNPEIVREEVEGKVSLQGNLDPCAIYAHPEIIREEVKKMLQKFGTQGYIANLGHGCFPDMNPVHVDTFIKSVQDISLELNMKKN